jgi:hypothetical protein
MTRREEERRRRSTTRRRAVMPMFAGSGTPTRAPPTPPPTRTPQNIAVTKGLLFPNVGHKCLMAKDGKRKKVKSRSSTKYETSSDEDNASNEEDNLHVLFANLNMQQKEKLNELISAIHEKDDLLDTKRTSLVKKTRIMLK